MNAHVAALAAADAALAAISTIPTGIRIMNAAAGGNRMVELHREAQQILDAADAEGGRDLTEPERRQLLAFGEAFDLERSRQAVSEFAAATAPVASRGRLTDPDGIPGEHGNARVVAARGGSMGGVDRSGRWGSRPRAQAAGPASVIFAGTPRDLGGFADARDFFASALSGKYDPRIKNAAAQMVEFSGESGGFTVPSPIAADLIDDVFAASTILPLVRTFRMDSSSVVFPRYQTADRSTGLLAGFFSQWIGEAQDGTLQKARIEALSVTAEKLAIYTAASSELLFDSPIFVQSFQPMLAKAAAYGLERSIVRGTGAGMPMGLLNDPALITVPAEGGQTADTIMFANVTKMFAALFTAGVSRAVWLAHPSTLPQLLNLSLANQPLMVGPGAQSGRGLPPLFGLPIILSEHLNPVGDRGDLLLVDLSQYGLFLRRAAYVETTNALHWLSDEVDMRLIMRGTGMGLWPSAGKRPGDSTPSESWAICLAAR